MVQSYLFFFFIESALYHASTLLEQLKVKRDDLSVVAPGVQSLVSKVSVLSLKLINEITWK